MKKRITKIICAAVATVVVAGVFAASGCSPYNEGVKLSGNYSAGEVVSNGGFAVEKGDYLYFINGDQYFTGDNTYGTPLKGAIMRIATDDLEKRNYSSVETVVPNIIYTANYSTGIFIYGDYIYYSTPSTNRNADGSVLNSQMDLKRTKLDGTESMKDAYITFPNHGYDFRFVEVDNTVYILYVATGETMYDEDAGVTNIHSFNTSTGKDTLLAYDIINYQFDAEKKDNPRMYYTMNVRDYTTSSRSVQSYNQIYTVTADATEAMEFDKTELTAWDDNEDRYINCGKLVLDGIGGPTNEKTPFNYMPEDKGEGSTNKLSYSYDLSSYSHDTVYYTRTRTESNNSSKYLFSFKDSDLDGEWNPIKENPEGDDIDAALILRNGSAASNFKFVYDEEGNLKLAIYAESDVITVNYADENGKLTEVGNSNKEEVIDKYFDIVHAGSATLLSVEDNYLYYSVSGGNGYTFYRIDFTGKSWEDYHGMPEEDEINDYTPVRILDLDASTTWYRPEFIDDYILFASETDNMTSYNYVMCFDLRAEKEDGTRGDEVMTNAELDALNKLFDGVIGKKGIVTDYADNEKYPVETYANLSNAVKYLFYTGDIDYVKDLAKVLNAELDDDDNPIYSEETLELLAAFLAPTEDNDWAEYTATRTVNGEEVYANRRDYYYSVLGKMTSADAKNYRDNFRTEYLKAWPKAEEKTWWEGLNTVAKVFFIIGMCVLGLLVIAFIAVMTLFIIRQLRGNAPKLRKRRIKVDTTDDKDVNVYEE